MSQERIFSPLPKKEGGNIKSQKWGLTLGLFREIFPREKILISSAQFFPLSFLPRFPPFFPSQRTRDENIMPEKEGEIEGGGRPSPFPTHYCHFLLVTQWGGKSPPPEEKIVFFWSMARSDLMAISTFLPTAAA